MLAGCSFNPIMQAPAPKQPSPAVAAAVINQVADPNLFRDTYRNCSLGRAYVRTDVVNDQVTVTGHGDNSCEGVNYRKEGETRPTGIAGANPQQ